MADPLPQAEPGVAPVEATRPGPVLTTVHVPPREPTTPPFPPGQRPPGPTPLPTAQAGFALHHGGHGVASITFVGQYVAESGPLDALHLAEAIRYHDGSLDIVGYFPHGTSPAHNGDPFYPERIAGRDAPQYLSEASKHFEHEMQPTAGQSLEQFLQRQSAAWERSQTSSQPPRYDASGQILHNSNSAMIGSVAAAGRPDVSRTLVEALEPPGRMHELERGGLSAETASDVLVLERRLGHLPSAPGASNSLRAQQVEARATSEPDAASRDLLPKQVLGAAEASGVVVQNSVLGEASRLKALLQDAMTLADHGMAQVRSDVGNAMDNIAFPQREATITAVRTTPDGDKRESLTLPLARQGKILYADEHITVQAVRGTETLSYPTAALAGDGGMEATLTALRLAAASGRSVDLRVGMHGIDASARAELAGPGPKLHIFADGVAHTVGAGYHEHGRVHTFGPFVAIASDRADASGLTVFNRAELLSHVEPHARSAVDASLRDGHTVKIDLDAKAVAVHDVAPARHIETSHALERAVARPAPGLHLER